MMSIAECGMHPALAMPLVNAGYRRNADWKKINPKSEVRNPQPNGFTLLEVMVAVAIMSMVLVTLLGLKNRTMQDVALAIPGVEVADFEQRRHLSFGSK